MVFSRRSLIHALVLQPLLVRAALAQARRGQAPRPLPAGAVTHDWRSFLGPLHNSTSSETKLTRTLPPALVWEMPKGEGYAAPAIAGERLVFLKRDVRLL